MTALRWGLLSTARITRPRPRGEGDGRSEGGGRPSRDEGRARTHAALVGASRWHGSLQALLADPDVDAIYNPLPNSMHAAWVDQGAASRQARVVREAVGRRLADVEAVFDAADAAGLVCAEAFMWRHTPQAAKLRELLDEGVIGTLRSIRAGFSFPLTDRGISGCGARWTAARSWTSAATA
jgi:predicted dehydrogenase